MEIISIVIAASSTFFVFLAAHWLTREVFGELGKLICYIIGTVLISLVYLVWCLFQQQPIPALTGFLAYAAITAGAGAGTLTGHLIDDHSGLRREVQVYQRRVDDDS